MIHFNDVNRALKQKIIKKPYHYYHKVCCVDGACALGGEVSVVEIIIFLSSNYLHLALPVFYQQE